ncbi:unnamed protein product [Paramecium octaurelia]|uniref:Uncharacterized protein n=1 Tax=Paramecium octaurelia TaxID=43137 RepID=A0A8S1YBZ0_PAROT|nr:unnamed protein product [Paramecium octaurelia]
MRQEDYYNIEGGGRPAKVGKNQSELTLDGSVVSFQDQIDKRVKKDTQIFNELNFLVEEIFLSQKQDEETFKFEVSTEEVIQEVIRHTNPNCRLIKTSWFWIETISSCWGYMSAFQLLLIK